MENYDKVLRVEFDEIRKVPRIFYKDKEVKNIVECTIKWKTRDDSGIPMPIVNIEYLQDVQDNMPVTHFLSTDFDAEKGYYVINHRAYSKELETL